jgi:starvation-inducible DNA-binding protein
MASTVPRIDIGISNEHRAAIAHGLGRLLADTYTLYLNTHNFHWNVTGPMFNTLHAMFMSQYTELWGATDPIAERIRSLGHPAPGSYRHETVARTARSLFALVGQAGDEATADLLTQRLAVHEQTAWMLRALLED